MFWISVVFIMLRASSLSRMMAPRTRVSPVLYAVALLTTSQARSEQEGKKCPSYGCPLYPTDVHYNTDSVKAALNQFREVAREKVNETLAATLDTSGRSDAATFTLIGYKGGQLTEQINQDRSLVVSPYFIDDKHEGDRILLGVFDGHAPLGELVSEYTATELPKLLASKLRAGFEEGGDEVSVTTQALIETFIELDESAPADESGGCTATVVLRQGRHVFFANAGDSRSFLVTYRPSTQTTKVIYITREDKPDLPDEKERVEKMGGQVYIPIRGTSRVVYHDPNTGAPTGLAMSRSIGDWAAGKLGVIPNPLVQVFDLEKVVRNELTREGDTEIFVVDDAGEIFSESDDEESIDDNDDVHIFAVSATDGMMDFLDEYEIARILAHSLYDEGGPHPVSACERLIFAAANGWQQSKQGRYRDDIAIAVSKLRAPPAQEAVAASE